MTYDTNYLIVGAGIGGLALGLALLRAGRSVKILEAAPRLGEVGAGISISPNAALAMQYLGLGPALEKLADCPERTAILHYKTGEVIAQVDFGRDFVDRYGAAYYQLHRADLHTCLLHAVQDLDPTCVRVDSEVTEIEQTETGVAVVCRDGFEVSADVLFGCDGLRSLIRDTFFATSTPEWTGQVAFRATLPSAGIREHLSAAPTAATVGPAHMVMRYFIRHGEMVNLVAIAQSDAWKEEGWSHPATVAECLAEHEGWNADTMAIINAVPSENLFKWALYVRQPLESWVNDKVVLLGDSAHPMLPFLGMGAAMALEDAVVLSRCIDSYDDIDIALAKYETARLARANKIALDSIAQGKLLQNANPDKDDWKMEGLADNYEWRCYSYNAATVEI